MRYIGLIDCNNFFASCERIFRPDLLTTPVAVLSNNDGCVIARSNEVKALGVPMGAPLFKWKDVLNRGQATIFSANFGLYSDISRRIVAILSQEAGDIEVYSVDESFVMLDMNAKQAEAWGAKVRARVLQEVGVPVSVGLAPSKTLAKAGSEFAKKHPESGGVVVMSGPDDPKYTEVLDWLEIGDIWGVGRRYADKLQRSGIYKASDLAGVTHRWAREQMTIRGEILVRELQGELCLKLNEHQDDPQKSMLVSRSFGAPVRNLSELEVAVAGFVASAAHKLRRKDLLARDIGVFAQSNRHKGSYTSIGGQGRVNTPTSDNARLTKIALDLLRDNFQPGVSYRRAGIYVPHLVGLDGQQMELFSGLSAEELERESRRGDAIKELANRYGKGVVISGAGLTKDIEAEKESWRSLSSMRSQEYTTKWDDIPSLGGAKA